MKKTYPSERAINDVIDKLLLNCCLDPGYYSLKHPPGYFIKKLNDKDREILKHAKIKHFNRISK
jgi:hypothetical protein